MPIPPSQELAELFYDTASRVDLKASSQAWKIPLCRGYEDAEIALSLALTPNLKDLHITLPPPVPYQEYETFYFRALIREATRLNPGRGVHRFNCLTTLSVGPAWAEEWDARFEFPLYCVADFLKLPSLQRFGASDFRDTHALDQYSPWTLLPRASKLKDVSLSSCLISSQVLKTLLGCFERLE